MSRLIESFCLIDGEFRNLEYHLSRMEISREKLFNLKEEIDLKKLIEIPQEYKNGKFKCRIVYDREIKSVEFLPYQMKTINSFRLYEDSSIDYRFKYEERGFFDEIKSKIEEEEVIITQNGQICDTSFTNLVFYDSENWITPTSYLLNGTMRQFLLDTDQIIEDEIFPKDLNRFVSFKLINAMMNLEESPELSIDLIR